MYFVVVITECPAHPKDVGMCVHRSQTREQAERYIEECINPYGELARIEEKQGEYPFKRE